MKITRKESTVPFSEIKVGEKFTYGECRRVRIPSFPGPWGWNSVSTELISIHIKEDELVQREPRKAKRISFEHIVSWGFFEFDGRIGQRVGGGQYARFCLDHPDKPTQSFYGKLVTALSAELTVWPMEDES